MQPLPYLSIKKKYTSTIHQNKEVHLRYYTWPGYLTPPTAPPPPPPWSWSQVDYGNAQQTRGLDPMLFQHWPTGCCRTKVQVKLNSGIIAHASNKPCASICTKCLDALTTWLDR